MSGPKAEDLTPEGRIDPANIRRWFCLCAYSRTVALATCHEEAQAVAAMWFSRAFGKDVEPAGVRVRVATDAEVDGWLAARYQELARPSLAWSLGGKS